jgi:hypothetical protein
MVGGPLVAIDLSNLCRDQRFLAPGVEADHRLLDRFIAGLERSDIAFGRVHCIADRSLAQLVGPTGSRQLRHMEQTGELEYSAVADERLLELAFGSGADEDTMVASMDSFDDFRRSYTAIQGCTERFLGWGEGVGDPLSVFRRDMGVHAHQRLSRKEESEEFKARRLRRQSIVRRAGETYFQCNNPVCLVAQLWPERVPELPRFDDRADVFVCASCGQQLIVGDPRPAATQVIVFLHGSEQCRFLLEEGHRVELGRRSSKGCIGLESRLGSDAVAAISRRHVAFSRDRGLVTVEDLGSRNGSVLRWSDGTRPDERLIAGEPKAMSRGHTVALPAGISVELSGRMLPVDGDLPPEAGDFETDERATRILATGP